MPCAYAHKPLHHHPPNSHKILFCPPLSHFLDEGLSMSLSLLQIVCYEISKSALICYQLNAWKLLTEVSLSRNMTKFMENY